MGKFLRCRNNEALKSWRFMDTCAADWMKQWTTWSMSRLINESMKAWTLIHWVKEAMNQCISQSMNQCLDESTKHWSKEGTKALLCMSETDTFFAERLLHWATSLLRYLFSQLLLWAAPYLCFMVWWLKIGSAAATQTTAWHSRTDLNRESTAFRIYFSTEKSWKIHGVDSCLSHQATWWWGWNDVVDMMVWVLNMTIVRNLEVF